MIGREKERGREGGREREVEIAGFLSRKHEKRQKEAEVPKGEAMYVCMGEGERRPIEWRKLPVLIFY